MRKAQCIARPEKQGETICAPSHQQSICGECCNARPSGFTDTANCLMYQDPHCITASAICLAILHRKKNKVPKVPKCQVPNTFQISPNCLFYYFLLCFGTLALLALLTLCARPLHVLQHHFPCLQAALSGVVTARGVVNENRFSTSLTV